MGQAGTTLCLMTLLLAGALYGAPAGRAQGSNAPTVVGDAIPGSLTGRPGDAARGRVIVCRRGRGKGAGCHGLPAAED